MCEIISELTHFNSSNSTPIKTRSFILTYSLSISLNPTLFGNFQFRWIGTVFQSLISYQKLHSEDKIPTLSEKYGTVGFFHDVVPVWTFLWLSMSGSLYYYSFLIHTKYTKAFPLLIFHAHPPRPWVGCPRLKTSSSKKRIVYCYLKCKIV